MTTQKNLAATPASCPIATIFDLSDPCRSPDRLLENLLLGIPDDSVRGRGVVPITRRFGVRGSGRRLLVTKVQIENLMWCVVAPGPTHQKNQKVPPSVVAAKFRVAIFFFEWLVCILVLSFYDFSAFT